MIRVLLVDDHELFRAGMARILADASDICVVAEAASGEQAIPLGIEVKPDVVLMDIRMPGIGGIEATRKLVRAVPGVKVIALSVLEDDPFPAQLNHAGAIGYLSKGSSAEEVLSAIRSVYEGRSFFGSMVAKAHMKADWKGGSSSPFEILSSREMQITLMILDGRKYQEISDELNLSPKTISTHKKRICEKLNVRNDVDLVRLAYRYKLLQDEI